MSDHALALEAVRAFFVEPTDANAAALRPHLANEVVVAVHTTNEIGADAAVAALQQSLFHHVVHGGRWEETSTDGEVITQVLRMPPKGIAAGCNFRFTFDGETKLERIEGGWILPPAKLAPEPIVLTAAMRARIDRAEEEHMPVLFAYGAADGRLEQIYRSSTHTHGDDQLAFWNPRPDGSFLTAIVANPQVSAIYRHDDSHEMLEMSGRARVIEDAAEARRIYDARADIVRRLDPDRKGVAVVVELDRVSGLIHAADTGAIERIMMARGGAA